MGQSEQTNNPLLQGEHKRKVVKTLRYINIGFAILVVVFSIFSSVIVIIDAVTSLRFFLIVSPVFMSLFSLALLAAEFKVRYILKKMPFLKTALGKGIFYLYLSSIMYYYFEIAGYTLLAWVGAISMFVSSMIYFGIHCGCSKGITEQDLQQQYEKSYKERLI